MKKALILVLAALVVPSAALAATTRSATIANPKVTYVLKGKLSAYTAYNKATSTNGSITIHVSSSNYHGKALKTQSLTFVVGAKTIVTLHMQKPIADSDRGLVTVRAPLRIPAANLAATLQAAPARLIVDMGPPQS
jgi:hypothetical protein